MKGNKENKKETKECYNIEKLEKIKDQNCMIKKISKIINRNFLERFHLHTGDIQVKNRCILTGRSKGICSDFRLSRIKTRDLGSNGLINGFKKVSW